MPQTLQLLKKRYDEVQEMDRLNNAVKDERSQYTRMFLDSEDHSKYDDDKGDGTDICYKSCNLEFEVKAEADDDGKERFKIKGFASTSDLDDENDIILPKAFKSSLDEFLSKGIMLFMHDWWSFPVGKWTGAKIKKKGLYVEGFLSDTVDGKDAQVLVDDGILQTLSVGFRTLKDEYDHETGIRTITDLKLYEVSVVTMPANPHAIFERAKDLNLKSHYFSNRSQSGQNRKGNTMPSIGDETIKTMEQITKDYDSAEGTIEQRLSTSKNTIVKLQTQITDVQGKAADLQKGLITMDEFKSYTDKSKADFESLVNQMKDIQTAVKEKKTTKYAVKDWRGLMDSFAFLRDDDGKALPTIYQKAYHLLNLPVDYDATESGWMVKGIRNLNDCAIITDAYMRAKHGMNYQGMHTLKAFQTMADLIEKHFDHELGMSMKALSTGAAGSGLEWIPSLMSGEIETLFRLTPSLVNFFRPAWNMPSATAKFPILVGAAIAYLADEAVTENPKVLVKTNLTTGNVLFNTRTFAAAIPSSRQMMEDAIMDLVPMIREELVTALNTAEEDAIINGDNSATHMDTGTGLVTGDDDARVAYQGLRKIARVLSNTWDSTSTTLGGKTAAFEAGDLRYNRQLLGPLGIDPSGVVHVLGISGYYQALSFSQVTKANEFGMASTWLSGKLPALDGAEIYISQKMREDLNASGIYDNSVKTKTSALTLHKNSFMPGQKRGIGLEFKYDPEIQQALFIGTMRRDFKNLRPSSQLPVSEAYNITS